MNRYAFTLLLFFLPTLVSAQAVQLRFKLGRRHGVGNAVYLGKNLALTAGHCVEYLEMENLTVGGHPASVVAYNGELGLLKVNCPGVKPVRVSRNPATPGTISTHLYCSTRDGKRTSRNVTWKNEGWIIEGIEEGMSGSGFYDANGDLVGIADKIYGACLNVVDISQFLQDYQALDWSEKEHEDLLFNQLGTRGRK